MQSVFNAVFDVGLMFGLLTRKRLCELKDLCGAEGTGTLNYQKTAPAESFALSSNSRAVKFLRHANSAQELNSDRQKVLRVCLWSRPRSGDAAQAEGLSD
jgi:hypothetical protein